MRVCYFTLLILFFLQSTSAQDVVVVEDFQTWPGEGWTDYKLGIGGKWRHSLGAVGYIGYGADAGISNDSCNNWLVSPQVYVNGSNYELKFWELYGYVQYYNYSGVLISTGSGDPGDGNFVEIYTTADTAQIWSQQIIDLSAYNGQNIYIAFQYIGTWHEWMVDEVSIAPDTFTDASVSEILNPTWISTSTGNENILVRLYNNGTVAIDSATIDWWVDGDAQVPFHINNLNLIPGLSIDLNIGSYNFNAAGSYEIKAAVTVVHEFNSSNDTITGSYDIATLKDGDLTIASPKSMFPDSGTLEIITSLSNKGNNIINDIEIDWELDGISQPSYTDSGLNLYPGESTTFTIGQALFIEGVHNLSVDLILLGDTNPSNNSDFEYVAIDTFWESFEGDVFPSGGWTVNFGFQDKGFNIPPHDDYYYVAESDNNFFGIVTDTLFTPVLNIQPGDHFNFHLQINPFLAANHSLVYKDPTTGMVSFIQSFTGVPFFYEPKSIDISAASGIHSIGIVTTSFGPGSSAIDLITSDADLYLPANDLGVTDVEMNFIARKDSSYTSRCILKNLGSSFVTGSNYTIKLMQQPGVQLASTTGVDLGSWEEAGFQLSHTFTALDRHELYIEIDFAGDDKPGNNTSTLKKVQVVPKDVILVEHGHSDYHNLNFPFDGSGDTWTFSTDDLSQTIYKDEDMPSGGYIYGFYYEYFNLLHKTKYIPLKFWISQNTTEEFTGAYIPPSDFQLVFDDSVEVEGGKSNRLYIPLDSPLLYTGLTNLIIQAYAYNPEWPPSIIRFKASDEPYPGPYRTISSLNYFDLDPADPPIYFNQFEDFAFTTFVMDPVDDEGVILGKVSGTGGSPIEGAQMEVINTPISATSDNTGEYELTAMPFGTYALTASAFGYADTTSIIHLDTTVFNLDFFLEPLPITQVEGYVTGSNAPKVPLENVQVDLIGYVSSNTFSDADGYFLLDSVYGNHDYRIQLKLYGYEEYTANISLQNGILNLDTIILQQELIAPYHVTTVRHFDYTKVYWNNPLTSDMEQIINDQNVCSFSYTNEPFENVWLGNKFSNSDTVTITSVEITIDIWENAIDLLTLDIFDKNEQILVTSDPFLIIRDTTLVIDVPNITLTGDYYAMVHWEDDTASTNALCIDQSAGLNNTAYIKYPSDTMTLLSDYIGSFPGAFMVRVNTLEDGNHPTNDEALTYNLYKGLTDDFINVNNWTKINLNSIPDGFFADSTWVFDTMDTYRYAVDANYASGNSEKTISNVINIDTVSDITGFNPPGIQLVNVYPNPVTDFLTVSVVNENPDKLILSLRDSAGRIIHSKRKLRRGFSKETYDLTNLPAGNYFLLLELQGDVFIKKIIKL